MFVSEAFWNKFLQKVVKLMMYSLLTTIIIGIIEVLREAGEINVEPCAKLSGISQQNGLSAECKISRTQGYVLDIIARS